MDEVEKVARSFEDRLSQLRHELRTPIGHIIGYAELIDEDLESEQRNAYGHDLAAILNAGQKMLAIIDQHLNVSKKSLEEIELEEAQFALRLQLNHIGGYAEMMREDAVEREEEGLIADLGRITSAERSVLSLIEDIGSVLLGEVGGDPTPVPSAPHDLAAAAITGLGGDILVIDDNQMNRELLVRRLERGGYSATTLSSGDEALVLLDARSFDLILLDHMMPGLSGLETLQKIKANPQMRSTPVIMLSATDDADVMVRCILSGADDYVAKPFNPVLLIARINAALEKVRLRRNAARQIKVFISSPGDVIPERQIAKMVLGRLNEEYSGRALLVPILWEEEPLLVTQTFQAQIHPPHETDIYLGVLWSRIGSPLPDTIRREDGSLYESGTAFEFEDALEGHRSTGKPEMLLYLKTGYPDVSLENRDEVLDRLEQIDQLNAYRERMLMGEDGSYAAAFHMFERIEEFETMLEIHLRKLVQAILMRQ
ncbi:response regulator [Aliiroseovarius sp. KMU-50]|uniref:histidine kinase n=1 Tax=Aliiroseovarius salicola TaxID=3009082 RepID=A0ABT4W1U0_9RHOB|nr:response regulator [Aliiroseovarius sp. KMU-50]MDA5093723.1 response regulator [Aliiroseovarius sp. KMU-50]